MHSESDLMQKIGGYLEYHYRQGMNIVNSLLKQNDVFCPLTLFESLAINIQTQKKIVIKDTVYTCLVSNVGTDEAFKIKWELELRITFINLQWEQINLFKQSFTLNVNIT